MAVLHPGQMLDGTSYRVVREIGAGGMGVVYEIEHVRLKKRYVAKVIHEQVKNDAGAAKRMEREAQVLAAISHPNIVQVHDVGTTPDGISYFVMEKLEGVDLRSMMKHGPTRIRSIEIVTDVLEALEYVHRRGIVHRDIKPENIFLSEQPGGTVTKVLDFGIVHIFDSDGRVSQGRITKTGGFVGTLYYAAPEQMQGKAAGPPNDIYAAGLVLFELLAGKGPFDDDPGVGLSRCFKPAPLLTEFVPEAPHALTDTLSKALKQDPAQRPSAGALAADLRAIATALKTAPGVAEDEALRAEVHDLLRHMAPLDLPPPKPAAGRLPTPDRESMAPVLAASNSLAVEGTAAPRTPMMPGAPGRRPSDPRDMLEATLASATGATGSAIAPVTLAVREQARPAVPVAHSPTMPGAGAGIAAAALPQNPAPHARIAQAIPSPPMSPRSPAGVDDPRHLRPSTSGQSPPLFASTAAVPVQPPNEVMRSVPARHGDTSGGLSSTVDSQPGSTPLPRQTGAMPVALATGVLVLLAGLIGGAFVLRHNETRSAASLPATPAPQPASSTQISDSVSTPTSTPPAAAEAPSAPSRPLEAAATSASASAPATPTAAPTTTTATNAAAAPKPLPHRGGSTSSPSTKPAPASAPTPQGAEKDGYVKVL